LKRFGRNISALLLTVLLTLVLGACASAKPVHSFNRDTNGYPEETTQYLAFGYRSALQKSALPAVPYGGVNVSSNLLMAKLLYPDLAKAWFDAKVRNVTVGTPTFTSDHGSEIQGETGWNTSQDEMMAFLKGLPSTYMRMQVIGEIATKNTSGDLEGTFQIPVLVFSKPARFDPAALRKLGKPVVYFQGQIHGNEASGGEAMLALAKELAADDLKVLDKVSVVIIPRFNVDGAWQYQRGTNALNPVWNNFDQNRDHTGFQSPIIRLIHSVVNAYRPEVCIDCHEMGYGLNREYSSTGSGLGYRDYYLFDLVSLVAHPKNVPAKVTALTRSIEAGVAKDLNAKGLKWDYYFYGWNGRDVAANVLSSDLKTLMSGDAYETTEIMEGPPDEGMTDSAMSLKPAVSMLFETRSPKVLTNYKTRVYAHQTGLESVLKQVAASADLVTKTVTEARSVVVAEGKALGATNPIILWVSQKIVASPDLEALSYNDAHTALAAKTLKLDRSYRNDELTTVKSVARPYAYILSGDRAAAAQRLSYTGVRLERLSRPLTVEVEAYTIAKVVGQNDPSVGFDVRGGDYFPFTWITKVIDGVTTTTKTVTFPSGSYLVRMAQPAANHAALALEPLGNRNFGNYWLTLEANGKGGQENYLPASLGAEYPAYRVTAVTSLSADAVFTDQPFMDGAVLKSCTPVTAGDLADLDQSALGKRPVAFAYSFAVASKAESGQTPTGFSLILPATGNDTSLGQWYLYDWTQKIFVAVTPSGDTRTVTVGNQYIAADGSVLAAATAAEGDSSSGGCNGGFLPMGALLLLVSPLFLRRR
jgi:Synergist-CTERM protein sorting domain-containing protein